MNSRPSSARAGVTLPSIMVTFALADQNKDNVTAVNQSTSNPTRINICRRPRWGTAGDNIWMSGGLKERRVELHGQEEASSTPWFYGSWPGGP